MIIEETQAGDFSRHALEGFCGEVRAALRKSSVKARRQAGLGTWLFAARESWALPVLRPRYALRLQNSRDMLQGTTPLTAVQRPKGVEEEMAVPDNATRCATLE